MHYGPVDKIIPGGGVIDLYCVPSLFLFMRVYTDIALSDRMFFDSSTVEKSVLT
jgi:hypothetical protein